MPVAVEPFDSESVVDVLPGFVASVSVTYTLADVPVSAPEQEMSIPNDLDGAVEPTPVKAIDAIVSPIGTWMRGVVTLQLGTLG